MSASKDRKLRQETDQAPETARKAPMTKEEKERRKYKRTVLIVGVILIVFVLATVLLSSKAMNNKFTAVKIGDDKFTVCDLKFYKSVVNQQYYSTYSQYAQSLGVDVSKLMPDDDTVQEQALSLMQMSCMLHHEGENAGYTLTDSDQSTIDSYMSSAASAATQYKYETTDSYLGAYYCKGMTESVYRSIVEYYVYASSYGTTVYDGFTYSADDLSSYYAANADKYDRFTYYSYLFSSDSYDDPSGQAASFLEELKAGGDFLTLVQKYATDDTKDTYTDESSVLSKTYGSSLSSDLSGWLTSSDRKANDCDVIDTDSGTYVVSFVARDNNQYYMANFRQILIEPDTVTQTDYDTTEAYQAAVDAANEKAKESANMYYELWKENPTEDNFTSLVSQYSADTTEGGLYQDIYKGKLVDSIDEWLFDSARKTGDSTVVQSSYGYHILYYVGASDTKYCDYVAENDKRQEDFSSWESDHVSSGYDVSTTALIKLAKSATSSSSSSAS